VDMLLFGRVTYQLMASYWPTPAARTDDPIVAERMNNLPKIVVSRTLSKAEWQNTRLVKENAIAEISKLKQQPGKDMAIFGSSDLTVSLAEAGLIDEYRIFVNPLFLGAGKPVLHGLQDRLHLKLINTRQFNSGVVMLCYQPE
jgi:dihydrofolate reductase